MIHTKENSLEVLTIQEKIADDFKKATLETDAKMDGDSVLSKRYKFWKNLLFFEPHKIIPALEEEISELMIQLNHMT